MSSEVHGRGLGDDVFIYLFSSDTKAKATKAKMNNRDDIKLKWLLLSKGNHRRNEKAAYERGDRAANHIPDKGLIPQREKELTQLQGRSPNTRLQNGQLRRPPARQDFPGAPRVSLPLGNQFGSSCKTRVEKRRGTWPAPFEGDLLTLLRVN